MGMRENHTQNHCNILLQQRHHVGRSWLLINLHHSDMLCPRKWNQLLAKRHQPMENMPVVTLGIWIDSGSRVGPKQHLFYLLLGLQRPLPLILPGTRKLEEFYHPRRKFVQLPAVMNLVYPKIADVCSWMLLRPSWGLCHHLRTIATRFQTVPPMDAWTQRTCISQKIALQCG